MKHFLLLAGLRRVTVAHESACAQTLVCPSSTPRLGLTRPVSGLQDSANDSRPHHRVLAYAEQVARQHPSRVKLIPYGTTYEGRQLMVVAMGSEANMARLEEIRTNNLKRIGLMDGNPTRLPLSRLLPG